MQHEIKQQDIQDRNITLPMSTPTPLRTGQNLILILEAALNLGKIKNPFGSVQTNPEADAWWVPLFIIMKKCIFGTP